MVVQTANINISVLQTANHLSFFQAEAIYLVDFASQA